MVAVVPISQTSHTTATNPHVMHLDGEWLPSSAACGRQSLRPYAIRPGLHPLHAILLSFPIALFPAALASDIAYLNTAEIQWSNLAQWAITGALLFGAPTIIWAAIDAFRSHARSLRHWPMLYLAMLTAMWVLGLINAFKHSQDAWSSVGTTGLLLSILCTALALAAGWVAHGNFGRTTTVAGEPA